MKTPARASKATAHPPIIRSIRRRTWVSGAGIAPLVLVVKRRTCNADSGVRFTQGAP